MEFSRRDLLKVGLFGSAALMLPAERIARAELAVQNRMPTSLLPEAFTVPFATPPVLQPVARSADTDFYVVTQKQVSAQILPGLHTDIWGYNGITPGPTIVTQQGRQSVVRQINALPEVHPTLRYNVWTSTHLHGSCSLPQYDGYASDITKPGQYKDYVYPNSQEARTLWYHDHGVHITGQNAYMGLAAQYILHDPIEQALPIPHGEYDVPLIIRDAMFEKDGQLVWDDNSESSAFGDVILVNGRPWPLMKVEPRKYRFRVLNASVSRSYRLALDTGDAMTVIGTDAGLMPHPQPVGELLVGMAERYEVVIDFSRYKPGQRVVMRNLEQKNNVDYDTTHQVMAFEVGAYVTDPSNNEIPQDLSPNMPVMGLKESDAVRTRKFEFERKNSNWTINGTTWDDVVNSDYKLVAANPGLDDIEIWEFENRSGGWFHPVHVHMVDFRILDRNGKAPEPYELGPKDVVYVAENETVRVIMKFDHLGKYMIHCHNLVHEDHDMMTQFEVGSGGDDPIEADPCKDLPAPDFVRPVHDRPSPVPAAPSEGPAPAIPPATPQAQVFGTKAKSRFRAASKAKRKAKPKPKAKPKLKAKKNPNVKLVSRKRRKSPTAKALKVRRPKGRLR